MLSLKLPRLFTIDQMPQVRAVGPMVELRAAMRGRGVVSAPGGAGFVFSQQPPQPLEVEPPVPPTYGEPGNGRDSEPAVIVTLPCDVHLFIHSSRRHMEPVAPGWAVFFGTLPWVRESRPGAKSPRMCGFALVLITGRTLGPRVAWGEEEGGLMGPSLGPIVDSWARELMCSHPETPACQAGAPPFPGGEGIVSYTPLSPCHIPFLLTEGQQVLFQGGKFGLEDATD